MKKVLILFLPLFLLASQGCASQSLDREGYIKVLQEICSKAKSEQTDLFENVEVSDQENLDRYKKLSEVTQEEDESIQSLRVDDTLSKKQEKLKKSYTDKLEATVSAVKEINAAEGNLQNAQAKPEFIDAVEKIQAAITNINSVYDELNVEC
jgi:competence protein ComGC